MKKTIALLVIITSGFAGSTCFAQKSSFFIEEQNIYNHEVGKITPQAFFWLSHDATTHWGMFGFAMANNSWGEIYAGPKYTAYIKHGILEFGVGVGFESSKNNGLRNAAYIFGETRKNEQPVKSKNQFMIYGEHGPSGPWAFVYYTYGVTKHLSVGLHTQRFSATGPRIQFDYKSFMLYVIPGIDIETGDPTGHLGLRLYF
ncbi:hypothetical protein A3C57_01510 [Candidatus Nomurabacteria bacterium RIFCSPHIGHO2_02_FULL_33_12]|uniref:Outer membrane protein beta-barrel domain-containing protein n=1 Tax=Candidatus Nomurabacteria bacterium RIFCSPLOWO2_01_FULL_33_17 TaxID=1801764 RepID=A0A1F6WQQ7_9BACT|nr:MAG: hypothetical protein A3C57_01510 [Candidatus Nomurabacteria bacterium RIFCSPHIGHO2_02_FULL_33_12]OGI84154.1 MAG: hypothetical protein A2903_01135 [Candidatus Nomurabacteria bacterium RIFCSPLOWO2_01_FULL_33_17]